MSFFIQCLIVGFIFNYFWDLFNKKEEKEVDEYDFESDDY
jgi:hypothetical protein